MFQVVNLISSNLVGLRRFEISIFLSLLDMVHSLLKQGNDMLVFDTVIHFLAVPARLDQPHLPQPAQVVRDG